jgi:transposase
MVMPSRDGPVHVVTTTRAYKGKVYKTHLLRRSYRENGQVKNQTVGNLSHLPDELVELVRRSLQGESFAAVTDQFEILRSVAQGHIRAVRTAMQRLGFDGLISSRPCRERDLVVALVTARIVAPHTKLATTRWWHTTTLAEDLGVTDADEEDLYDAMDWLLERQGFIEKKLAERHLDEQSLVLYDLSSSYFEGTCCPLARRGHNRDGKKGKLQVNYGIVTDRRGCPVAVSVFEGNTSDAKTLMPQVEQIRNSFGIKKFVIVGDRGMISQKAIDTIKSTESLKGLEWITALKAHQIGTLIQDGALQLGLFDERNLFELSHPDYPGERLVACRNAELARLRDHKRQSLLRATTKELEKVQGMVRRGKLEGKDEIGVRVGKVVNKYKVAKHFSLEIQDDRFDFGILENKVAAEAALDGIYVIRTGLTTNDMKAEDAVRSYKLLSNVERAFRSIKTIDLKVRPIHHRLADRVRSHIFLCMLAYYVEWNMREVWRPVLFADEDQEAKKTRDPVAPAERSDAALQKVHTRTLDDGTPVHSFQTLMQDLSTIVRNTCRTLGGDNASATFQIVTTPNPQQQRAMELIKAITM